MKLIIGLGNPGEKYQSTRHNLGFRIVEELAKKMNGDWQLEKKFKSEILQSENLLLVKPQTFMNQSGLAVVALARFYKIPPQDVIVMHDDLDLLLGKIKVRLGGSASGHHGVESIIKELSSDQFIRVRVGIGNTKSHLGEHQRVSFQAEKFVLEPFLDNEKSKLRPAIKQAVGATELLLEKGLEVAQNQFN